MPELDFRDKEVVRNHHLTVPFRPLVPDAGRTIGDAGPDGSLILHGDNLDALKALLPRYASRPASSHRARSQGPAAPSPS